MTLRWWKTAALVAAVGIFGSGCIINVSQTRETYERCDTGDSCRGASVCQSSNLAISGMTAGNFCTQSCSAGSVCPGTTANNGVCLEAGGVGQCFLKCSTNSDCFTGMTCGTVATAGGGSLSVCIPGAGGSTPVCGGVGQACCAGGACNDSTTTCASDNVCKPRAYNGCTAGSIGAQCTDALSNGGTLRIQTTCQRPPFTNAGPDGFCTAVCDGTNNSCPVFPGTTTGCYRFEGMTQPMCFADCASNPNMCPTGTACVQLTSNSGAQVRVCAPPVSG